MKWEDLKVYRPLDKEDIRPTYKKFTKIIYDNFEIYGFKQIGRKLYRKSEDLLHIIEIDTRGSWQGMSDSFKTKFEIVSIFDVEIIVNDYTLFGETDIEYFIPNIRNHYRINKEYELLAEYLTKKIIDYILPYFEKYKKSQNILLNANEFKIDRLNERNANLILFSELNNKTSKNSFSIIENKIEKYKRLGNLNEIVSENVDLLNYLKNENWNEINFILNKKKQKVYNKLKMKEAK